jgi:putative transposase
VATHGQPPALLRTAHRDTEAALRWLKQAIRRHGLPEIMPSDGSDANAAASKRDNAAQGPAIAIRQGHYGNTLVEQEQRAVKRVTRPMWGFKSFTAAQATLVGRERMPMLKTRQLVVEAGDEGRPAAAWFDALAASSPPQAGVPPRHDRLNTICAITSCGAQVCTVRLSGLACVKANW